MDLVFSLKLPLAIMFNLKIYVSFWKKFTLSLSYTKHGWAHGSHTVYSVIHGITGTSIGLQPHIGTN